MIFAELSSKFYLLLGEASTANLKRKNEIPKFLTSNVCPNGCNIFNGIAGVTKGEMIIYDVF